MAAVIRHHLTVGANPTGFAVVFKHHTVWGPATHEFSSRSSSRALRRIARDLACCFRCNDRCRLAVLRTPSSGYGRSKGGPTGHRSEVWPCEPSPRSGRLIHRLSPRYLCQAGSISPLNEASSAWPRVLGFNCRRRSGNSRRATRRLGTDAWWRSKKAHPTQKKKRAPQSNILQTHRERKAQRL